MHKAELLSEAMNVWLRARPAPPTAADPLIRDIALLLTEAHEGYETALTVVPGYEARDHVPFAAFLTYALVNLADALGKLSGCGFRVDDRGPLIQPTGKQGDLTALVHKARNIACHASSEDSRRTGGPFVRWAFIWPGSQGRVIAEPNLTEDDVLIGFGDYGIYLTNNVGLGIARGRERLLDYART